MVKKVKESRVESLSKVEEVEVKGVSLDEPSWYHYVIVLFVLFVIFGVFYCGYYFFGPDESSVVNLTNSSNVQYKYPYVVGNVTYNLYFASSPDEVASSDYIIEPSKIDILNTISYRMVFFEYNGTDNGQVSLGSTKLVSFLRLVFHYRFTLDSFYMINETNCSDSSIRDKVIVFNPYTNRSGVFFDRNNGCLEFDTQDPRDMVHLVDKFILNMVTQ